MAMTHCKECNREISDQARTCPGCGFPRSGFPLPEPGGETAETKKKNRASAVIYGAIVGGIIGLVVCAFVYYDAIIKIDLLKGTLAGVVAGAMLEDRLIKFFIVGAIVGAIAGAVRK